MIKKLFFILFIGFFGTIHAQNLSNYRSYTLETNEDTIRLDSVSILAESFILSTADNHVIDPSNFSFDPINATLIISRELKSQELTVSYRTYPFLFSQKYFNKNYKEYKEQTAQKKKKVLIILPKKNYINIT